MTELFTAEHQALKVRFVQALSLVAGATLIWGGVDVVQHYGLHPTEGGELASLPVRLALGGGFLLAGVGIVAGIVAYGWCYVLRASAAEGGARLHLVLAGLFVPVRLELEADRVERAAYRHGRARGGGITVNAPWYSVRVRGRRLPLVIDLQGDFPDRDAARRLLVRGLPGVSGARRARSTSGPR